MKSYFKILFAIIIVTLVSFPLALAQEEVDVKFEDDDDPWFSFGFGSAAFEFYKDAKAYEKNVPTIEFNTGKTQPYYHKDVFTDKLAEINSFEIKLLTTTYSGIKSDSDVVKFANNGIYLKNALAKWSSLDDDTKGIRSNAWTFGFSSAAGYGYRIGKYTYINLIRSSGINWTKISFDDKAQTPPSQDALDIFGSAFRFGDFSDAGINVRFTKNLGLNAGYERSLIYPRHLFWKWLWSKTIETGAEILIDVFIDEVAESTPAAAPVVYFLLKNGLSYGFYELRSSNMNWPSESVPPFMYENFKVGLSFYL
jgi:hypothetical protein